MWANAISCGNCVSSAAVVTDSQVLDKESLFKLYQVTTRNHLEWGVANGTATFGAAWCEAATLFSNTFYCLLEHNITVSTKEDFHLGQSSRRLRVTLQFQRRKTFVLMRSKKSMRRSVLEILNLSDPKISESCWCIRCDPLDFHSCTRLSVAKIEPFFLLLSRWRASNKRKALNQNHPGIWLCHSHHCPWKSPN